jgi:predicted transposase YdaD
MVALSMALGGVSTGNGANSCYTYVTEEVNELSEKSMPLPFDATLKDLAQNDPTAFVAAFDAPPVGPVAMLNVDLSTVTAATDLVFGVGKPLAKIVHVDCQSRAFEGLGRSMLRYNALLHHQMAVPVHSVALLLHPRAQHPSVYGKVHYGGTGGEWFTDFRYSVVRLWERPVEELLRFPPSLLPLATLGLLPASEKTEDALAEVVRRILGRLHGEVDPQRFRRLAMATFVLTGMRVPAEVAKSMFLGVQGMQDSSTYQAILDEGREEGLKKGLKQGQVQGVQKTLLLLGRARFGEPNDATRKRLLAIKNVARLERLSMRVLEVRSWKELLSQE